MAVQLLRENEAVNELLIGADRIAERLLDIPAQIQAQQETVQLAKQAVEEAKGELQLAESLLMAEIQSATDPRTGKPPRSSRQPTPERGSPCIPTRLPAGPSLPSGKRETSSIRMRCKGFGMPSPHSLPRSLSWTGSTMSSRLSRPLRA